MHQQDEYLDSVETAKRLGVSTSFLNKARVTGDGPPYAKFGSRVRYHWPTAKAWADRRTHNSTSEYSQVA
jgi:hypothetical protein